MLLVWFIFLWIFPVWQQTSIILWKWDHIKHAALKVAFHVQVHLFHSFQQEEILMHWGD